MSNTHLRCPPPPPGMDIGVDSEGLVFIRIVSFRYELHRGCKLRLPKQILDAG